MYVCVCVCVSACMSMSVFVSDASIVCVQTKSQHRVSVHTISYDSKAS